MDVEGRIALTDEAGTTGHSAVDWAFALESS
jgi:hypothetical protein